MGRKEFPLWSDILIGSLGPLGVSYRVVHRCLEGKGKMQSLRCEVEIAGRCGCFLSNSAGKGKFLPSRFADIADIDQVVRIVE